MLNVSIPMVIFNSYVQLPAWCRFCQLNREQCPEKGCCVTSAASAIVDLPNRVQLGGPGFGVAARHGVVVLLSGGRMDELPLQQRGKKAVHQGGAVNLERESRVAQKWDLGFSIDRLDRW